MVGKASINAKDETINSGFCTGNRRVLEHIYSVPVKKGQGTVRSCNVERGGEPINIRKYRNSGAFSGNDPRKECGAVDEGNTGSSKKDSGSKASTESLVVGTLQSFNAGIPPRTHCHLKELISGFLKWVPGTYLFSFSGVIREQAKTVDDKDKRTHSHDRNAGTRLSFNAVGEGSSINMKNATINSGYCSGNKNVDVSKYDHSLPGECKGTKESFNAMGGHKIDLEHACINSGGYAGNSIN